MSLRFFTKFIAPAFLITGGALRIWGTGQAALWTDEAVTLYRCAYISIVRVWENHAEQSGDVLLEMILRPLLLISKSVWMLRLPSVLAGLACLWLVWKLMDRFQFNPTQKTITAFLVSFAPGLIWQTQDARVYSLLAFFFLLSLLFLLEGRWLAFILSLALMCYCHNTAPAFVLAALVIAWLLYPPRLRQLIVTSVAVGLIYIPQFLLIFQHQQWISLEIAPLPPFSVTWFIMSLIQAFWASTHTDGLTVYLALFILCLTMSLIFSKRLAPGRWALALATIIPFGVIFFLSVFLTNIFVYRVIMPLGFTFFLWLGWELGFKEWKLSYRGLLAGLWLLLVWAGYSRFDPADMGGRLDQAATEIRSQWRTGDTLVITTITGIPFDYYLQDLPMIYTPVSDNFFLQPPGLSLMTPRPPDTPPSRLWVIVPDDVLLDPAAHLRIQAILGDAEPVYEVNYMQTSPLLVYLIDQ